MQVLWLFPPFYRLSPTERYKREVITDNEKDIDKFFDLTIEQGLEGIVAKRLDSPYSAGARKLVIWERWRKRNQIILRFRKQILL